MVRVLYPSVAMPFAVGFSSCPITKWSLFSTSQSRICPCALLQPIEHSRSDVSVPIPGSKRHCILLFSLGTLRTPCDRLKASPLEDQDYIGKNHRMAPLPISQTTLVYRHPAEPQLMADTWGSPVETRPTSWVQCQFWNHELCTR